MGLKGRVMELLRAGDEPTLGALAVEHPPAMRFVFGRLWDPDEELRQRAARVIGVAATARWETGLELVRGVMWGLNDESATNGRYGIPALGEIGYNSPEMIAPFVGPLASLAWDDGLRVDIIRALTRIAEAAPELVRGVCETVLEHVRLDDAAERRAWDRLLEVSGGMDES
jgi:hypothetical protein